MGSMKKVMFRSAKMPNVPLQKVTEQAIFSLLCVYVHNTPTTPAEEKDVCEKRK